MKWIALYLALIGSAPQMLIVVCVIIILFGGKKMQMLARGLGRAPVEFLRWTRRMADEVADRAEE